MHHYQFTSAAAAAAAATYPNHQFYQHPEINHLDQNHSNHNSNVQLDHNQSLNQQSALDTHCNQWAQYTQQHQHQQQHHQHLHHHQQQQQQQQSQHQQSQPSHQQNDQQQMYQTHHHQSQQQQQQQQQQHQHPNYYAVINALNGYHHQQQHHHHYHQDSQAQQTQQQLHNQPHQHSAAQHYATASSSPTHSNGVQKSIRDTSTQSSAINQLQAFALSAPEAAAAAAAVTFKPFYSSGSAQINHSSAANTNQTTVAALIGAGGVVGDGTKVTKIQKQRVAPKTKPIKRQQDNSATTINGNQRDNINQQAPQTNLSRSQRRYAGRASCDCPNCIELERLKRHGLEPPADSGLAGEPVKKLMHVCHHAGCGKEYEKTSHLRAHLRWHTSERLSACRHSDCGKRFTRTDELRKHMKTHHSQPSADSRAANKQAQQVKQQA